jgi:hypothetical protein
LNDRTAFLDGAVPQEQIDEVLVWDPQLGRHFLEIVHRPNIEANGDLALELLGIGFLRDWEKSYSFLIARCPISAWADTCRTTF